MNLPASFIRTRSSGMAGYVEKRLNCLEIEDDEEPPSKAAIFASIHLLEALKLPASGDYPYPHVTPGGDGNILYEWRSTGKNVLLQVSRIGDMRLHRVPADGPCPPGIVGPTSDELSAALKWFQKR